MDDNQVSTSAKRAESWLIQHERLIVIFLVLIFGGWLGNRWMNYSAEQAKSALAVQQAASQAAAAQAALAAQTYQVSIDALAKQTAALDASQRARNAGLAKQQTATTTFPPDQVVTLWQGLLPGINKGNIVPTADGGYKVDAGPAIDTVNTLEEVPVLRANLSDETKLADTTQTALTSCSALVDKQKTEIAEDKKTCDAKTASLKADARKSKRTFFILGFISGLATRIFVKW